MYYKGNAELRGVAILCASLMLCFVAVVIALSPRPYPEWMPPGPQTSPGSSLGAGPGETDPATKVDGAAKAPPGTSRVTGDDWYGVSDKATFSTLTRYANQRDEVAFNRRLAQELLAGTAILFRNGEVLYARNYTWDGMVQVRRPGQDAEFWTNIEAISTRTK